MKKPGGHRNYGYGKQLAFAANNAISDRYGDGRFATRAANFSRMKPFIAFMQARGIKNFRNVDATLVDDYVELLAELVDAGRLSITTAHNRLSSLNICLQQLRGDGELSRSPAEVFGNRSTVRTVIPLGMDKALVTKAALELIDQGHASVGLTLLLARFFGVRMREAALMKVRDAVRQIAAYKAINVVEGTKGGRRVDRWVPGGDLATAIVRAADQLPGVDRNLIPEGKTWLQWRNYFYRTLRPIAKKYGLSTGPHDLRAAYSCERYRELTDCDAPVIAGARQTDRQEDLSARKILAQELGHGRPGVLRSYIGSSR